MASSLPRGIRNHNPGNLNYVGQAGAHKEPGIHGRFAVFTTAQDGLRALRDQLLRYQQRDGIDTIDGIIAKWAPPSDDNNTNAYTQTVASHLNVKSSAPLGPLTSDRLAALMHAIIQVENGQDPYGPLVNTIAQETAY